MWMLILGVSASESWISKPEDFEAIAAPFPCKKLNQSVFIEEQWAEGHMLDWWH